MKAPLAAFLLLHLYTAGFSQQSSTDVQAIFKEVQRKTDSVMNSQHFKDMMKKGLSVNTDSLTRAAMSHTGGTPGSLAFGAGAGMRPDTNLEKLPSKDSKTLGALPQKPLSAAALQVYAQALDKKLTPAFRQAFGTILVNTDKYSPITLSNASAIATEMGMLDQAVLLALKSVERDPANPIVLNNAGAVLHKGGLEIAAIPMLETAEQSDPGNSTIENNLGQSYLTLGDRDKATQHLQAAIAATPYHPLANSSLAQIELEKGNRQAALTHVENSLRGGFTDKAWHMLYKVKKDPVLMDYFRTRYKQPEYFNEDKYHLPFQCEKVSDIPAFRAEYEAYHKMLDRVKRKFDQEAKEEGELGKQQLMQKVKNFRPGDMVSQYQAPFMELANALLFDLAQEMTNNDADKIARAQKFYNQRTQALQQEYDKRLHYAEDCGARIGLSNDYMEKMAIETRTYQQVYLHIYKDFYLDNAYWSFFASNNKHLRRSAFCRLTSGFISVLQQLAVTHFLDVSLDCASNEKEEKEAEEVKIEGECPLTENGVELPFDEGAKFNVNCEETEFQAGEVIILNVKHKFGSGETMWAIGPGVGYPVIGEHGKLLKVPTLGPLHPGVDAGIKAQGYMSFKNGALQDYGLRFLAEIDILGWGREFSVGFTLGSNTGLNLEPGMLKNFIDDSFGPPKEVQVNKNVPIYNPK
jgi:tetratricopeptide (TPR) repeat protein